VPSPNVVDPQTMTNSMTDMQILGRKFWALGGLNQKSKKTVLQRATWRNDGQKWLDSIEKQKRRIDLKEQRDGQTDRQSQRQKIIVS